MAIDIVGDFSVRAVSAERIGRKCAKWRMTGTCSCPQPYRWWAQTAHERSGVRAKFSGVVRIV